MKIAAFYENIALGAEKAGVTMEAALTELRDLGLSAIYISYDSLNGKQQQLLPMFERLGLFVEGIHAHMDFAEDSDEAYLQSLAYVRKRLAAYLA